VPAETPAESVFIMPVCCCTGPAPTGRRTGSVRALSSAIARPGGSRWSTSRWPRRIFAPPAVRDLLVAPEMSWW